MLIWEESSIFLSTFECLGLGCTLNLISTIIAEASESVFYKNHGLQTSVELYHDAGPSGHGRKNKILKYHLRSKENFRLTQIQSVRQAMGANF